MLLDNLISSNTVSGTSPTVDVVQVGASANVRSLTPEYSYKVKLINPSKKSDAVFRQLNGFTSKFQSSNDIRIKLIEEFKDQVPNTVDFTIGYLEGSRQTKICIVSADDLQTMYKKYPSGGNVTLWCDQREVNSSRKRKLDLENRQDSEKSTY